MKKFGVRIKLNNKIKIHLYFPSECSINMSCLLKQNNQLKVCFSIKGRKYLFNNEKTKNPV